MTRFITQTDLKNWGERDSQSTLPELVRRLILATGRVFSRMHMPCGDGVALHGWDGIVECQEQLFTIEAGLSVWEMGTNTNPQSKAEADFQKRTKEDGDYSTKDATFVFVTPKVWEKSKEWESQKSAEGKWKNVVVITAVELETWLEERPSVGIWLADHLGKAKGVGVETPETHWERWSKGKEFSILPSCILGGRMEIAQQICSCIKSPQILHIQAHSREEAMAFSTASILKEGAATCIVAFKAENARDIANNYENTIIITYATDNWEFATKRGNSVIVAVSPEEQIRGSIQLPIIDRNAFVQSLEEAGIEHEKATRLATTTGRNIMSLRRELGIDFQKPSWVSGEQMNIYLPAVLLGRWSGKCKGDQELVEIMSNRKYNEYEHELQKELLKDDCPLIRVGDEWQTRSASEVYRYCSSFISNLYFERLSKVVEKIIADADPEIYNRFDNNGFFIAKGHPKYSGRIKYGVFLSLIFLALDNEDKMLFSQQVLRKNLQKATTEQILSIEQYFPLIAEASPEVFMEFVENDLKNGSMVMNQLFNCTQERFSLGPSGHYHHMLFSLEALAWDTGRLTQIADILIRLFPYFTPSNNAQKPLESFKNIFRFILPQTFVPCKDRLKIHERLCKRHPDYAYTISILIAKSLTDCIFHPNNTFTWRDYDKEPLKEGRYRPLYDDVDVIVQRTLEYCEYTEEQVCELLSISAYEIMNPWRNGILQRIAEHQESLAGNKKICDAIRQTITDNYRYSNRKGGSKKDDAISYNELLEHLSPKDAASRNAWLFENEWVNVRQNAHFDYEREQADRKRYRETAIKEVLAEAGIEGILALAEQVGDPVCLGRTFGAIDKEEHYLWIIEQYSAQSNLYKFVSGYIWGSAYDQSEQSISFEKTLALSQAIPSAVQQASVLSLQFYDPIIGDYIDSLEQNAQDEYWANARLGIYVDIERVIKRLTNVKRYATAIEYIALCLEQQKHIVSDELMYDTLMLFWQDGLQGSTDSTGYYIKKIIKHLDKSTSAKVQDGIIILELVFFNANKGYNDSGEKLRILTEMLDDPDIMIQFIDAAYLPDNEEEVKIVLQKWEDEPWAKFLHDTISHIMWDLHGIPCVDCDGKVNYTTLTNYVNKLIDLGKQHHRLHAVYRVIGKLLANIPINDECADEELCELLEQLGNERIDNAYQTQKFNSRGVIVKGLYQGGDSEFALEKRYTNIADKAIGYTHLPQIYRGLAKDYHVMGREEDNDAELRQLRY